MDSSASWESPAGRTGIHERGRCRGRRRSGGAGHASGGWYFRATRRCLAAPINLRGEPYTVFGYAARFPHYLASGRGFAPVAHGEGSGSNYGWWRTAGPGGMGCRIRTTEALSLSLREDRACAAPTFSRNASALPSGITRDVRMNVAYLGRGPDGAPHRLREYRRPAPGAVGRGRNCHPHGPGRHRATIVRQLLLESLLLALAASRCRGWFRVDRPRAWRRKANCGIPSN